MAAQGAKRPRRARVVGGFLVALSSTCHAPAAGAAEPSVARHYRGSFEAPEFENTTYEELRPLLFDGRPFVVLDGARGLPMENWTCDFVRKTFPGSRIRHEGKLGPSGVINGVPMSSNWMTREVPFQFAAKFPPGAPKNRPFYWDHAKAYADEPERGWGSEPEAVAHKIMNSTAVPYWLPSQGTELMGQMAEMWFHPRGAGAAAHMDPHCFTTVSFCFSGRRKWRMMVPPEEPNPMGYGDGLIYGTMDPARMGEWQPTFELEAPAGSGVVVYPGMVHETLSLSEECSSSISHIFERPLPAAYYRSFWPRFALIGEDVGVCGDIVEGLVTLGWHIRVRPAEEAQARKTGARFAAMADDDKDGRVTAAEMKKLRKGAPPMWSHAEIVAFHDVDRDGVVTTKEVEESWVMFATAAELVRKRRVRVGSPSSTEL